MPIPSHPITSGQPIGSPSNPFLCLGNWEHLLHFFAPSLVFHFHLNVWLRAAPVATACSAFWSSTAQNSDCSQNHSIHPSFHFEGKIQSTKQEQGGWGGGVCSTCSWTCERHTAMHKHNPWTVSESQIIQSSASQSIHLPIPSSNASDGGIKSRQEHNKEKMTCIHLNTHPPTGPVRPVPTVHACGPKTSQFVGSLSAPHPRLPRTWPMESISPHRPYRHLASLFTDLWLSLLRIKLHA